MTPKKMAVLGAFAMAADFSLQGFEVHMWSRFPEEFSEIQSTKTAAAITTIPRAIAMLITAKIAATTP